MLDHPFFQSHPVELRHIILISGFTDETLIDQKLYKKHKDKAEEFKNQSQNLEIEVVDIAKFNLQKVGPDHKEQLRKYILDQSPNLLVISWCYTFNGDVLMTLRRNGELSRMILEAEMRDIGIASENAKLHPEQKEVLDIAQDPNLKILTLAGGTGSGKTILAAETVKIWAAQHLEDQSPVSYHQCYFDYCILSFIRRS